MTLVARVVGLLFCTAMFSVILNLIISVKDVFDSPLEKICAYTALICCFAVIVIGIIILIIGV